MGNRNQWSINSLHYSEYTSLSRVISDVSTCEMLLLTPIRYPNPDIKTISTFIHSISLRKLVSYAGGISNQKHQMGISG